MQIKGTVAVIANTGDIVEDLETSDDKSTTHELAEELTYHMQAYKTTQDATGFFGMRKMSQLQSVPDSTINCTVHVGADSTRVQSLISKLAQKESEVGANSGSDTGVLTEDWYVPEYTGHQQMWLALMNLLPRSPVFAKLMMHTSISTVSMINLDRTKDYSMPPLHYSGIVEETSALC